MSYILGALSLFVATVVAACYRGLTRLDRIIDRAGYDFASDVYHEVRLQDEMASASVREKDIE